MDEIAEVPLVRESLEAIADRHGDLTPKMLRKVLVHELIDRQVSDVLDSASAVLTNHGQVSHTDLISKPRSPRLSTSATMSRKKLELERFLYQRVYRHPNLIRVREVAQRQLRVMFDGLVAKPALLPDKFRRRLEQVGVARAVGDYLAGMTDRYCEQVYEQHFRSDGSVCG